MATVTTAFVVIAGCDNESYQLLRSRNPPGPLSIMTTAPAGSFAAGPVHAAGVAACVEMPMTCPPGGDCPGCLACADVKGCPPCAVPFMPSLTRIDGCERCVCVARPCQFETDCLAGERCSDGACELAM